MVEWMAWCLIWWWILNSTFGARCNSDNSEFTIHNIHFMAYVHHPLDWDYLQVLIRKRSILFFYLKQKPKNVIIQHLKQIRLSVNAIANVNWLFRLLLMPELMSLPLRTNNVGLLAEETRNTVIVWISDWANEWTEKTLLLPFSYK